MTRSYKLKTKKYNRSSSSYYQGGLFRKGGGLNKFAKSQYYSDIKSDYQDYYDDDQYCVISKKSSSSSSDYYDEHDDDQYCIISKKGSSSSFKETTTATNDTTTTIASSATSDINNDNVCCEELEWMMVIFVCDYYEEEPKRYNVPVRYISSLPVFKALVRNCGHKFGALISQGWLVLRCSILYFESIYNLAMCQAKEEEEEKEKARHRNI